MRQHFSGEGSSDSELSRRRLPLAVDSASVSTAALADLSRKRER